MYKQKKYFCECGKLIIHAWIVTIRHRPSCLCLISSSVLGQLRGKSIEKYPKFHFYFTAQMMHPIGNRMKGEETFLVYEITDY